MKNNFLRKSTFSAHYDVPSLVSNVYVAQGKRNANLRPKIDQPNPHLLALQLEDKQKLELRRKEHEKHVLKVERILESLKNFIDNKLARISKKITLLKLWVISIIVLKKKNLRN